MLHNLLLYPKEDAIDKILSNFTIFAFFKKFHPQAQCLQLVLNLEREFTYPDGTRVAMLIPWLQNIDQHLK